MTFVFLATLFFIVGTPNVAHAQGPLPSHYNWAGLSGNHTLYLSTDITSNNARYIGSLHAQANTSANSSSMQSNAFDTDLSNTNAKSSMVLEQYIYDDDLGTYVPLVSIPFSMSSVGDWKTSLVTNDPPNDSEIYLFYDHMANTENGLPTTFEQIQTGNNYGLNVSGPNLTGKSVSQGVADMLVNGFGLVPDFGNLAAVYGVSTSWESLSGVNQPISKQMLNSANILRN